MLKIGDFSKLSRISIRMLRHYDEIGLLKPEKVDEFTGYRYYDVVQLLNAGRIQVLKNMGFGLSAVSELLDKFTDAHELEKFLLVKQRELEEQEQQLRQRIRLLDNTLKWLRKDGKIMGYDVSLKEIPERYVASVRMVISSYAEEGKLWQVLMEETAAQHLRTANPCYSIALFHDGEHKEKDVDVEVQLSVSGKYQNTEHVRFKTVPSVQVASAVFKGSYDFIPQVNEALARWIQDHEYDYAGVSFNIYYVSPSETQNPEEYVTEICYPVKKK